MGLWGQYHTEGLCDMSTAGGWDWTDEISVIGRLYINHNYPNSTAALGVLLEAELECDLDIKTPDLIVELLIL